MAPARAVGLVSDGAGLYPAGCPLASTVTCSAAVNAVTATAVAAHGVHTHAEGIPPRQVAWQLKQCLPQCPAAVPPASSPMPGAATIRRFAAHSSTRYPPQPACCESRVMLLCHALQRDVHRTTCCIEETDPSLRSRHLMTSPRSRTEKQKLTRLHPTEQSHALPSTRSASCAAGGRVHGMTVRGGRFATRRLGLTGQPDCSWCESTPAQQWVRSAWSGCPGARHAGTQ